MRKIATIEVLKDYMLRFIFNDGSIILFNVRPYLDYPLYNSIKDINAFNKIKFDKEHIYWNKTADLHLNTILEKGFKVPEISRFYGLIITLYFGDTDFRHKPHIHVRYGDNNASFDIIDGELLSGNLPIKQTRLIQARIELHKEELLENWDLIQSGKDYFTIAPLK